MKDGKHRFLVGSGITSPWNVKIGRASQAAPKPVSTVNAFEAPPTVDVQSTLERGQRGAVVHRSVDVKVVENGFIPNPVNEGFSELIKMALLHSDRIDIPAAKALALGVHDFDDLSSIGIGARSRAVFQPNTPMPYQIEHATWETYKELEKTNPGQWDIWHTPEQRVVPDKHMAPNLAFRLEVNKLLIVPDANLPFEDFIHFRERHRDELLAFRHHLEDVARKLANEADPAALNHEIERFDAALSSYLRKAKESNIKKAVASMTAEIDWSAAVRSAFGGGSAGMISLSQGMSLTNTALAFGGGILASLSIKSAAGLKKADPSPFRYIARIDSEFGG